jgi:predicted nucleic acid-binding protein
VIVADSSAWISYLRSTDNAAAFTLRTQIRGDSDQILIGDLILLEIVQGARDDGHAAALEAALRRFAIVPFLGEDLALRAAGNYRRLRALGVTLRKTADLIIGTFCIEGGHRLLHNDRDFAPMAQHLGLRIV